MFLALLVGVGAIQLLRELGAGPLAVVLSVTLGIGFAVVHARTHVVRLWLSFLAVAPIVFLGLFLLVSDTARLLDSTAAHAVTVEDPSPVVMLVLDELPLVTLLAADGTIDEALFPNFAALAADSHWFRRTTSVASTTMYAVPAMLSGILPSEDQAAIAADHPDNLFTLLGDTYDLDVTESVTRLCPGSLCPDDDFTGAGLRGLLADARDVMEARVRPDADAEITAGFVEEVAGETPEGNDAARLDKDTAANHPARFASMLEELDELDDSTPPRCTTSTCCCPTSRSDTWRTAPPTRSSIRTTDASSASGTSRRSPRWPANATCSKRCTPTGCSASWWRPSRAKAPTTTSRSSSPRTTASRSHPTSRAGGRSDRTSNRSAWPASSCTSRSS